MIKFIAKTRRIGGSIVVTIPANIVRDEEIKENELLEINVRKVKRIISGTEGNRSF